MSTTSDHEMSVPESPPVSSVISSVQFPAAAIPFKVDSSPSGLNDPVNGAVPAVMDVAA